MKPKILQKLYAGIEVALRQSGITPGKSGRHMKFPYTVSAKIAQFPLFFYLKYNNIWMYYPIGLLVGAYVFLKIHRLSNSEASKRAWAEVQRKNAEKEHH